MRSLPWFAGLLACLLLPCSALADADDDLPNLAIPFEVEDAAGSFGYRYGDLSAAGGVADVDWTKMLVRANRSYEVLLTVGNPTLGVFNTALVSMERYNSTGAVLLQTGQGAYFDAVKTLNWRQAADEVQLIRLQGTAAMTAPTSSYWMSIRETTLYCPRYNNSGTQVSVLIMQAAADNTCSYSAHFFNEAGTLLATSEGTLGVAATAVLPTASVPGLPGTRGSARVAHTCGSGGIAAKLVALEPATGFSFDTICLSRLTSR